MDQERDSSSHRFSEEEPRGGLILWLFLDRIQERNEVVDDEVHGGDVGADAVGSAVAFDVESEAGEAVLGEEDGGGLERPADVVAVAVDHEDDATWRRGGGGGEPRAGEEVETSRGCEVGFGAGDAFESEVVLFWSVSPEVDLWREIVIRHRSSSKTERLCFFFVSCGSDE